MRSHMGRGRSLAAAPARAGRWASPLPSDGRQPVVWPLRSKITTPHQVARTGMLLQLCRLAQVERFAVQVIPGWKGLRKTCSAISGFLNMFMQALGARCFL